jgi:hypothetical protein
MNTNESKNDDFDKKKRNSSDERSFVEMVQETVNRILDHFLNRHPQEKSIRDFMDDDKNLYNEDGTLTNAYKQQIKEMEAFVRSNPIDEDIYALLSHNDIDDAMYSSIINFVNQRAEVIKEFERVESFEEEDFSPECFVKNILQSESYTDEERKQILETIEKLAEEDSLEALDDDVVRETFKKIINSNEKNEKPN